MLTPEYVRKAEPKINKLERRMKYEIPSFDVAGCFDGALHRDFCAVRRAEVLRQIENSGGFLGRLLRGRSCTSLTPGDFHGERDPARDERRWARGYDHRVLCGRRSLAPDALLSRRK